MNGVDRGLRLGTRAWRRSWPQAVAVYAITGIVALVLYVAADRFVGRNEMAAMAIGGLVGAVEILGRYRHAPFRAVLTWNGLLYIIINIAAAWAAYYMLVQFQIFDDATVAKELTQVLTAGFGSLVFMRSSIFKVRVGDSDIGIGPAAILDTLLLVADRGVDRREAVARAQDVTELVAQVRDPRVVAKMLTKYSLALMQNVDAGTSQELSEAISKIMADPDVPDAIKMDIVALRLGVVVGPDVLEAAVAALGDRLNAAGQLPPIAPPAPSSAAATTDAQVAAARGAAPAGGPSTTPSAADLKAEIQKAAIEKADRSAKP
jgi:hypothetical protein